TSPSASGAPTRSSTSTSATRRRATPGSTPASHSTWPSSWPSCFARSEVLHRVARHHGGPLCSRRCRPGQPERGRQLAEVLAGTDGCDDLLGAVVLCPK